MNVDMLPEEIWCHILLDLQSKLIIDICDINVEFKNLCNKNDIINKRKMKGFPRKSGQCKAHNVSKLYDYNELVNEKNKTNILSIILDKLHYLNTDLVRGDFIHFKDYVIYKNQQKYIFDGCNLIKFDYNDELGCDILPQEFTVVTNSVAINYWEIVCDIVWIYSNTIKDQLLNNIEYIELMFMTTFKYDNDEYRIYFINNFYDITKVEIINKIKYKFIELLNSDLMSLMISLKSMNNKLLIGIVK